MRAVYPGDLYPFYLAIELIFYSFIVFVCLLFFCFSLISLHVMVWVKNKPFPQGLTYVKHFLSGSLTSSLTGSLSLTSPAC